MTVDARAVARVDLTAIADNVRLLRAATAHGRLCAVVKADGYGHGAVPAARAALAGGAEWIGVAAAGEAADLRAAGIDCRVLVMGALTPAALDTALEARADVVAWNERFVGAVAGRGGGAVHVKLDSGMGRLGTRDPEEATRTARAAANAGGVTLAGAMTHFATADERGDAFFDEQLQRFEPWARAIQAEHPGVLVHAANSAAVLRDAAAHFDLVRPGVAVYGLDPFGEDPAAAGLRPALALSTYVGEVKAIAPGESAGYGRRFVAERPGYVATLPIGYGDGVRRGLTNNGEVVIGGRRYPIVGTVSMDNIAVDLGAQTDVEVGEVAVLIGSQGSERITSEDMARRLDTINYEITCGLLPRVSRVYTGP